MTTAFNILGPSWRKKGLLVWARSNTPLGHWKNCDSVLVCV